MKNTIETRYTDRTGVKIAHIARGLWQHIDTNDGATRQVGPHYKTKMEALSDHESYMRRGGWIIE